MLAILPTECSRSRFSGREKAFFPAPPSCDNMPRHDGEPLEPIHGFTSGMGQGKDPRLSPLTAPVSPSLHLFYHHLEPQEFPS